MPNFMYGPIFANIVLFTVSIYWVISRPPSSLLAIFMFLLLLFGNLALLLSYPIYFVVVRKKRVAGLEKKVYRSSLKMGLFVAFCVVGFLGLKAFKLWTILNLGLFVALCVATAPVLFKNKA